MKYTLLFFLLLAAFTGQGQVNQEMDSLIKVMEHQGVRFGVSGSGIWITGISCRYGTTIFHYDTVKVIAEVYKRPHKIIFSQMPDYDTVCHCFKNARPDSMWATDSTLISTYKVLAWEVWRKEGQFMMRIKRLTYNRKEELPNVLQSWRVEW